MEIGQKLKSARTNSKMTQEKVAEEIQVSRQTISNWENNKSYPDIVSVIKLSDLYNISLDQLLKGDSDLMKHLEESTDVVKSNKKLITVIIINIIIIIAFMLMGSIINTSKYFMIVAAAMFVISILGLFYEIIKRI